MKLVKVLVAILVTITCSTSWAADNVHKGPFCFEDLDVEPTMIAAIPAHYPSEAKRNSIEGKVTVCIIITTKGTVRDAKVVESSPPEVFEEAALRAAKRYRFTPGIKDGKPVEALVHIPMEFKMN